MIDGIIKADGTSRLMRANLPATYEEFKAQAAAGTLPLDVLFNADGWSQIPTFLNKANLLKDSTANVFGLGANAVPDDVFGVMSRFQSGLGNEYVWAKTTYTVGAGAVDSSGQSLNAPGGTATAQHTATFYNKADYVGENLVLSEAFESYTFTYKTFKTVFTANTISALVGKFFYGYDGSMWIVDESTYVQEGGNNTCYFRQVAKVEATSAIVGYVNSPYPNAYPIDDGYTYTALGQLGAKVQIATGSYTGTGTCGVSNKNSLTFDFVPKLVIILQNKANYSKGTVFVNPAVTGVSIGSGDFSTYFCTVSWSENAVSWYQAKNAIYQFNDLNTTFQYIAIG